MKDGVPVGFQGSFILQMQYREVQITPHGDFSYVIPSRFLKAERARVTEPGWYVDVMFDGVEKDELRFVYRLAWIQSHLWR
jgi:hypothetical protein